MHSKHCGSILAFRCICALAGLSFLSKLRCCFNMNVWYASGELRGSEPRGAQVGPRPFSAFRDRISNSRALTARLQAFAFNIHPAPL